MIGFLSGKPMFTPSSTMLLVNGVGYCVMITPSTRQRLVQQETVDLFIYSHIKEDCFDLYGFLTEKEKELFLLLITVDGVGPRTALSIMDRGIDGIVIAVQQADTSFFSSVPRVGKKSAQKIIIELKSKLGGEGQIELTEPEGKEKDVIDALISLGFTEVEGRRVSKTMDLEAMRIEEAVTVAIRELTRAKAGR